MIVMAIPDSLQNPKYQTYPFSAADFAHSETCCYTYMKTEGADNPKPEFTDRDTIITHTPDHPF